MVSSSVAVPPVWAGTVRQVRGEAEENSVDAARRVVRWVQYDAPLFVRVEPDEDGWGTEITKVILVVNPQQVPLARDECGHFLVYDEDFNRVANLDTDVRLDGIRGAVSVAEDKHRWPTEQLLSMNDAWSLGPDPRDDPDYHLTDEEMEAKYPDDQ